MKIMSGLISTPFGCIVPDKNARDPIWQGLPVSEDVADETNAAISLFEKSYDEGIGTYHFTITVNNRGDEPLMGTLLVAAYDERICVSIYEYSIAGLAFDGMQRALAEIIPNRKVKWLKVFCWDILPAVGCSCGNCGLSVILL